MLKSIILSTILLTSCSKTPTDRTWDVVANGGVTKVTPDMALSNIGAYVLKQTHKTIFSYNKNGNLDSEILKSWKTSKNYKSIEMCIDPTVMFDKEIPFTLEVLTETVNKAIKKNSSHKFSKNKNCVTYNFNESAKYLLYKLTLLYHAPSLPTSIKDVELGLGAYKVTKHSLVRVDLTRKQENLSGYNKIIFYDINTFSKENLNNSIEDINRISESKIPQTIKDKYNKYDVSILKSSIAIYNIKDSTLRKHAYNCIDREKLANILFNAPNNKINLKYVTPVGIPGSEQGKPSQKCIHSTDTRELIFANWKHEKKKDLQNYFDTLLKVSGVKVKVVNFTFKELNEMVWKTKKGYDIVVPFLDSTQNSVGETFSAFANQKQKFFNFDTSFLLKDYNSLMNISNKKDISYLVKRLNIQIEENHLAIPLRQVSRPFYFPKRLKSFAIGTDLLEQPDIGKIEL